MSCAAITTRPSPTPATPEHPHPRRPAVSQRVGHVLACGVAAGAPCAPRWCVAGGPAPAGGIRRAPVTAFDTFTTAIYDQFQSTFNGAGATMLAGVLVLLCLALLGKRGVGGRPRPHLPCRLRRCPPGPFRSGSVPPPFPRRGYDAYDSNLVEVYIRPACFRHPRLRQPRGVLSAAGSTGSLL